MQAMLFATAPSGPLAISSGDNGLVIRMAFATSCPDGRPSVDAATKVTKRQAAAAARQGVLQLGNDERIELARLCSAAPRPGWRESRSTVANR